MGLFPNYRYFYDDHHWLLLRSHEIDIKTIVVISFIAPDFSMYPAMIL